MIRIVLEVGETIESSDDKLHLPLMFKNKDSMPKMAGDEDYGQEMDLGQTPAASLGQRSSSNYS